MGALPDTPVVAVADGIWRHDVGEAGGNGAWLTGFDNVSYYYAHFTKYSDVPEGFVMAGEVIGYVGMTGNATGPHLHFEIHPGKPGEKPPVDPFATLLALCDANLPKASVAKRERTNVVAVPPGWRNWLTQSAQNRPPFGACGFESHSGHPVRATSSTGLLDRQLGPGLCFHRLARKFVRELEDRIAFRVSIQRVFELVPRSNPSTSPATITSSSVMSQTGRLSVRRMSEEAQGPDGISRARAGSQPRG